MAPESVMIGGMYVWFFSMCAAKAYGLRDDGNGVGGGSGFGRMLPLPIFHFLRG